MVMSSAEAFLTFPMKRKYLHATADKSMQLNLLTHHLHIACLNSRVLNHLCTPKKKPGHKRKVGVKAFHASVFLSLMKSKGQENCKVM